VGSCRYTSMRRSVSAGGNAREACARAW
jgi:hypothetical protein